MDDDYHPMVLLMHEIEKLVPFLNRGDVWWMEFMDNEIHFGLKNGLSYQLRVSHSDHWPEDLPRFKEGVLPDEV